MARSPRSGRVLTPEANLELDLGLDSMERVELMTELEQRFGVQLTDDQAHQILTVGQLIEAVRGGSRRPDGRHRGRFVGRRLPRSCRPTRIRC